MEAALSPWKEMVDPVSRAVWWVEHCTVLYCTVCTVLYCRWVEHVTTNPGVWSLKQFYSKIPAPIAK